MFHARKFQGCFKKVSGVFHGCLREFQGFLKEVNKDDSRKFKSCLDEVSMVF